MDNFNIRANQLPHAQGNILENDELPSDASSTWNHIKEWFPLETEPLAYKCLNDFFHGEQAMSESEQLENFLALKSLASQGYKGNFATEYVDSIDSAECVLVSYRHNLAEAILIPISKEEYHAILSQYDEKKE